MEFCKLILTFESVDKFLLCDHSNEIFSTVLSRSAVCFCAFSKRIFDLGHSGSERVKSFSPLLFFFRFFSCSVSFLDGSSLSRTDFLLVRHAVLHRNAAPGENI